ncbi:MAG: HAMP domain-containing protein [Anaerolineae bacterium]|nr:HAMP domain-containing protein [Anaerolineae bacterium]
MTLQIRVLLMVTSLLIVTILTTAVALAWSARQSLLAETEKNGILIAELIARSTSFADQVPRDVEAAIGEQMIVEATIAAHLVDVAEQVGLSPAQINARLQDITSRTALDEFWITDETGHAYLRNMEQIDFTFNPDPAQQPQAHIFWALLTGEQKAVIQEARQREVDTKIFKYAGVSGVDRPRIVQVGYEADFLEQLRRQVGLPKLVDELVASGAVNVINVVDDQVVTIAFGVAPGTSGDFEFSEIDLTNLKSAIEQQQTTSYVEGSSLRVVAPINEAGDRVMGAVLVSLPIEHVQAAVRQQLELAVLIAVVVLGVGVLASAILARRVTEPVRRLTLAATAIETGHFNLADLNEFGDLTGRADELGRLTRVFQQMAYQVYTREQRLKQEVQELRIEIDEVKKEKEVAKVTGSEYFQQVQQEAARLKQKRKQRKPLDD